MHFSRRKKIFLLFFTALLLWFWFCLPANLFHNPVSTVIEDSKGNLLNASIAADGQWRFPYETEVPEKFVKCITTFEDKRFYIHPGVDIIAIGRSILNNLKGNRNVQGGSTLTMQVMRLSRQKSNRSIGQKIIETIQAVRLEFSYSKKEILALYASNAPFGSNVVGLEAASWRYYGRSPQKLSWGQMAALAVLPNAPSLVHPGKNRSVLLNKRNRLLNNLYQKNIIDSVTCYLSKLEPLPQKPLPLPQNAPHLMQYIKKVNSQNNNTTKTRTTINGPLQDNVTQLLTSYQRIYKGNGINNICALVLEVETGNVLSYVGNIYDKQNAAMESDVDVVKAPRSPGSTLKPILYAAGFTDGILLPNTLLPDVPTQIGGYTPQNYDRTYDGAVPASTALSRSLNIPAVKLLQQYKYQRFYDVLKQLGMTTLTKPADNYGLSLILGGSEVTMWELAGIYAGMARTVLHQNENKGFALRKDFHPPVFTEDKKETGGEERINVLDATSIYFAFEAMREVMRPGEEGLWQQFTSSQKIAWKTGTSFGFRDAWAIGITPKYVVAVWAGNTNGEGRPGLIGVQVAAPVMFDIFRSLPSSKWFAPPQNNFSFLPVCRQSGFRANIDCPDADTIMVSKSADKSPLCPYHQIIHLDQSGTYRVNDRCESPANMIQKSWFVLPPTMEWYYKQNNHDYKVLPDFKAGCADMANSRQMEMIYPQQQAKIYVPLEITGDRGKTIFTASHRKPGMKIFWHLDGNFVGTTINFHQLALSPAPGNHTLTIVDEAGNSITTVFEILEVVKK